MIPVLAGAIARDHARTLTVEALADAVSFLLRFPEDLVRALQSSAAHDPGASLSALRSCEIQFRGGVVKRADVGVQALLYGPE